MERVRGGKRRAKNPLHEWMDRKIYCPTLIINVWRTAMWYVFCLFVLCWPLSVDFCSTCLCEWRVVFRSQSSREESQICSEFGFARNQFIAQKWVNSRTLLTSGTWLVCEVRNSTMKSVSLINHRNALPNYQNWIPGRGILWIPRRGYLNYSLTLWYDTEDEASGKSRQQFPEELFTFLTIRENPDKV